MQVFDSVVEQVGALLGVPLRVDDSIMGAHQPPEALEAVRSHLLGMSPPPPTYIHSCEQTLSRVDGIADGEPVSNTITDTMSVTISPDPRMYPRLRERPLAVQYVYLRRYVFQ